ncbi:hypothetical protein C7S18_10545 [Ahniella affigens]|uniref:Delta-60 repeat domain-containing protein n=1 Tax=Ahniella affigens TaxID=2021234 RepID=A0A2P1PRZ4_9GAMM|nr:hypothetical protein [Ahniella affigens]AVP97609.1 hypothetical protein C7S18_10545 [Ahniella affigens]
MTTPRDCHQGRCQRRDALYRLVQATWLAFLGLTLFWSALVAAQVLPVPVLASPNVDLTQNGQVRDLERLPNGGWLVAGNFSRVGVHNCPGIARLQADGSADTAFTPTTLLDPAQLRRIRLGTNGRTYALYTSQVLALRSDGTTDPTFTPVAVSSGSANSLAVVSDGVLVGGFFTQLLTNPVTTVSRLVKFNLDGSHNTTFAVPSGGNVLAMAAAGLDRVVAVGGFSTIGGQTRTGVALLDTSGTGGVISSFNPVLQNGGDSVFVEDVAVVGDSVYIVGRFTTVNGSPRSRAAKLSLLDGSVDPNWVVAIGGSTLNALTVDAIQNDVIISSGAAQTYANPPAAATTRLVAKASQSTGAINLAFDLNVQFPFGFTPLLSFAEGDAPTRTLVGGTFQQIGTASRFGLVQVDAAGQQDALSAHVEAFRAGVVNTLRFDPGTGRTYLAGSFRRAGNAARSFVLRLNRDGVVDAGWRPSVDERSNPGMAVAPGVGVFVAGNNGILKFDEVTGDPAPGWSNTRAVSELVVGGSALYSLESGKLLRFPLSGNGADDAGFAADVASARNLQYDPIGNTLFVVQVITVAGGGTENRLTRLDALTGAVLPAFDLRLQNNASVVGPQGYSVDGDGVWVAGNFNLVNGVTRASPARVLLGTGQLDPAVAPTTGATFNNGLLAHRGFFYGLRFLSNSAEVLRMGAGGGPMDPTWKLTANTSVLTMAGDGVRLLVGGAFENLGTENTRRLGVAAVLEADGLHANSFE